MKTKFGDIVLKISLLLMTLLCCVLMINNFTQSKYVTTTSQNQSATIAKMIKEVNYGGNIIYGTVGNKERLTYSFNLANYRPDMATKTFILNEVTYKIKVKVKLNNAGKNKLYLGANSLSIQSKSADTMEQLNTMTNSVAVSCKGVKGATADEWIYNINKVTVSNKQFQFYEFLLTFDDKSLKVNGKGSNFNIDVIATQVM